jgi:hypothetical protein
MGGGGVDINHRGLNIDPQIIPPSGNRLKSVILTQNTNLELHI